MGFQGVWNIVTQIATADQRREVLDWDHLRENLHKVDASLKRLNQAEALLWVAKVDETVKLFEAFHKKQAHNGVASICVSIGIAL